MAIGTVAEEKVADQILDDDAWLGRMLPVLRVRTYTSFPFFPRRHEVVALYRDEVVVLRTKKILPVPEAAHQPDGSPALRAMPGWAVSVPLEQIGSVISTPRSIATENDSLRISRPDQTLRLHVTQEETPNLYRAFRLLLGPRFEERRWRPIFGSDALLVVFAALIGAASLAWLLGITALQNVLLPALLGAAACVLMIGMILWIPGRRRLPRGVKKKPLKDLSGRQPFRLRVAGFALSAFGSLFVLYFFGDLLFNTIHPLLPGGTEFSEAWYLKLWQLAGLFLAVIAGGSYVMSSVGNLSIAIVAVLYLLATGLAVYQLVLAPSVEGFYGLLSFISPYVGLLLIYIGRRLISRNAQTAVADDPRAPILYLRSFEDDVEDTLTPHTGLANFFSQTLPTAVRRSPLALRVLYEFQPLRLLRSLFGRVTPTTELQLAAFFRKFGPFIAIGKPGERLATIGADRDFVDNDKWQGVVLDYLERARYVVLQAAGTQGFLWELRTVLTRTDPQRLLVCLSNFRGRQNDYEDFRLKAESVEGWHFPRSVGNQPEPQFLFFKGDRTPVMHAVSYRSPVLWPVLAGVTDLDHTLADFVDRDRPAAQPYSPKAFPGHSALSLLLTLAIAPALGGGLMYLALLAVPVPVPAARPQADAVPVLEPRAFGVPM